MALNYSGVFYLDKYGTKHTISTMYHYKKGEGYSTVWSSDGTSGGDNPNSYFTFTLLEDDTYSIAAADVTNMPTELIIPSEYEGKAVTQIPDYAFVNLETGYGCDSVKTLTIPSSITSIGQWAFAGATSLTKVTFSEGLLSIGDCAFSNANKLEEYVFLPDTLTTIGARAFRQCKSLKVVYIPQGVVSVGFDIFDGAPADMLIYCGAESKPDGWSEDWKSYNQTVIWGYNLLGDDYLTFTLLGDGTYSVKATDVSNLPSKVGVPFSYNGKAVTAIGDSAFMKASNITKVVVPNGVNDIGNSAFLGCSNLASVTISNSVTRIDHNAFYNCTSLTSVNVPNSVRFIGYNAFGNCSSLTSIYLPDTITTFDSMGGYMSTFSGCSSLTEVRLPNGMTEIGANMFHSCVKLATITIPNTVTKIGDYAFKNNGLESIIIPLSVSTMGTQAFATNYYNQNLVIYCKASSKPTGWASDWNKAYSGYSSVVWGYTG